MESLKAPKLRGIRFHGDIDTEQINQQASEAAKLQNPVTGGTVENNELKRFGGNQ